MRVAIFGTAAMGTVFFAMVMIIPGLLIRMFNSDPELLRQGKTAIRVVVMLMPLVGFQLIGSTFFMSIGKALPAFFMSLSRQIIFLIPLAIILPMLMGLNGVWVAFPIADGLSIILTILFLRKELKHIRKEETAIAGLQPAAAEQP